MMDKFQDTAVVVFDFDGTIVDSMETFADIAAEVTPKYYPTSRAEARRLYLETSGLPFFQQLETIFPGHPNNSAAAEEFERKKLEEYFQKPLFEGVAETVEHLKKRGIKVVVSSNNFQELVDKFVERTGIAFDMVLGFRENFAKGADHFLHIEKKLGVEKNRMVFVGDSIKDGERAAECGIGFIGKEGIFTQRQFKTCFPKVPVIRELSELIKILWDTSKNPDSGGPLTNC